MCVVYRLIIYTCLIELLVSNPVLFVAGSVRFVSLQNRSTVSLYNKNKKIVRKGGGTCCVCVYKNSSIRKQERKKIDRALWRCVCGRDLCIGRRSSTSFRFYILQVFFFAVGFFSLVVVQELFNRHGHFLPLPPFFIHFFFKLLLSLRECRELSVGYAKKKRKF